MKLKKQLKKSSESVELFSKVFEEIRRKYCVIYNISLSYCVIWEKKWYSNVNAGTSEFAGVFGSSMDGLFIDDYIYRVKTSRWLKAVQGRYDYAGILGQPIKAVAIKDCTYRVHIKNGSWLPWVNGYNINDAKNGYAGNGNIIDAIQIK